MSNVVSLFPPSNQPKASNVSMTSEVQVAHEVARYSLEMMLAMNQITQREFDLATDFVDCAYLFDYGLYE